jgi:hypothetical protein
VGVFEQLEEALKRVVPVSSLPMNYPDHSRLAAELVLELSGSVVMLEKGEYDNHCRRMAQVHRHEQAVIDGVIKACSARSEVDNWLCCLDEGHKGRHRAAGGYEFGLMRCEKCNRVLVYSMTGYGCTNCDASSET